MPWSAIFSSRGLEAAPLCFVPHLRRLAVLINIVPHFQDLTSLIPLFYDHVELAEDRSLKIPSISDDGEIQLDPKRDTAMSGQFGMGVSSQSECYSGTVETLCCYKRLIYVDD